MPTHYAQPKHYASIMNLISIAEQFEEIEIVISDNSRDQFKGEFLKRFERKNITRAY
jgi:hypothetical protein